MVMRNVLLFCAVISICLTIVIVAQNTSVAGGRSGSGGMGLGSGAPALVLAEILSDRQVSIRNSASQATSIRFASSDIFNPGEKAQMKKNESKHQRRY